MASSRAAQAATPGPTVSDLVESQIRTPADAHQPLQWRQFTFFDSSDVKDVNDLALAPQVFRVSELSLFLR